MMYVVHCTTKKGNYLFLRVQSKNKTESASMIRVARTSTDRV